MIVSITNGSRLPRGEGGNLSLVNLSDTITRYTADGSHAIPDGVRFVMIATDTALNYGAASDAMNGYIPANSVIGLGVDTTNTLHFEATT